MIALRNTSIAAFAALSVLAAAACGSKHSDDHKEHADHDDEDDHGHGEKKGHDEGEGGHDEHEEGVVVLSPEAAARVTIRTAPVESRALAGLIATTGRVGFDEDKLAHVTPRVSGRVTSVRAKLGDSVVAGQALYRVYGAYPADVEFARQACARHSAYSLGEAGQVPQVFVEF